MQAAALRDPHRDVGAVKTSALPYGVTAALLPPPSPPSLCVGAFGVPVWEAGGLDGCYGALCSPASTLRYPVTRGCTETPDPNLGDAFRPQTPNTAGEPGPQTQTLGAHLDPKPWGCTQTPNLGGALKTPNPNLGDAFRPPTQTLGAHLDPKPWRCTQTPNLGDALKTPNPNSGDTLRPQSLEMHLDPKPWGHT